MWLSCEIGNLAPKIALSLITSLINSCRELVVLICDYCYVWISRGMGSGSVFALQTGVCVGRGSWSCLPGLVGCRPTRMKDGGYARVHSTTYGVIPPSMQNCHLLATPTHGGFTIGGETMDA